MLLVSAGATHLNSWLAAAATAAAALLLLLQVVVVVLVQLVLCLSGQHPGVPGVLLLGHRLLLLLVHTKVPSVNRCDRRCGAVAPLGAACRAGLTWPRAHGSSRGSTAASRRCCRRPPLLLLAQLSFCLQVGCQDLSQVLQ